MGLEAAQPELRHCALQLSDRRAALVRIDAGPADEDVGKALLDFRQVVVADERVVGHGFHVDIEHHRDHLETAIKFGHLLDRHALQRVAEIALFLLGARIAFGAAGMRHVGMDVDAANHAPLVGQAHRSPLSVPKAADMTARPAAGILLAAATRTLGQRMMLAFPRQPLPAARRCSKVPAEPKLLQQIEDPPIHRRRDLLRAAGSRLLTSALKFGFKPRWVFDGDHAMVIRTACAQDVVL